MSYFFVIKMDMFINIDPVIGYMDNYNIPECMKEKKQIFVNIISPSYTGPGLYLGLGPEGYKIEHLKPHLLRVVHYSQGRNQLQIDNVPLDNIRVIRGEREGSDECENLSLDYSGARGMSSEILTKGWEYDYYKTLLDASIRKESLSPTSF
ncbi:MAG: hypothetical protein ABIG84_03920 [archaeon]